MNLAFLQRTVIPFILTAPYLLMPTPAKADIPCTLSCNSDPSCSTSLGEKPPQYKYVISLSDCENSARRAITRMVVWYPKKSILTAKVVAEQASIADLTSDGDKACSGLKCIFKVERSKIPGANPMGITADADSAQSSGARIGLPYDEVIVPASGLLIETPQDTQSSGHFTLTDTQGASELTRLPITKGRVVVPPSLLQGGERYGYRWQAGSTSVSGTFAVARDATVERVDRATARRVQDLGLSGQEEMLARIAALSAAGLRWNAQILYEANLGQ